VGGCRQTKKTKRVLKKTGIVGCGGGAVGTSASWVEGGRAAEGSECTGWRRAAAIFKKRDTKQPIS
jgi:hypothetical protein